MIPQVRWMITQDLKQIVEIEKECYADPWNEKTLKNALDETNCYGLTALSRGKVIGYTLYEIHKLFVFHGLDFHLKEAVRV